MYDQGLFMLGQLDADFTWECSQIALKKRVAKIFRSKRREALKHAVKRKEELDPEEDELEELVGQIVSNVITISLSECINTIEMESISSSTLYHNTQQLITPTTTCLMNGLFDNTHISDDEFKEFKMYLEIKTVGLTISRLEEVSGLFYMILCRHQDTQDRSIVLKVIKSDSSFFTLILIIVFE